VRKNIFIFPASNVASSSVMFIMAFSTPFHRLTRLLKDVGDGVVRARGVAVAISADAADVARGLARGGDTVVHCTVRLQAGDERQHALGNALILAHLGDLA